jgi:hypothetical protein
MPFILQSQSKVMPCALAGCALSGTRFTRTIVAASPGRRAALKWARPGSSRVQAVAATEEVSNTSSEPPVSVTLDNSSDPSCTLVVLQTGNKPGKRDSGADYKGR